MKIYRYIVSWKYFILHFGALILVLIFMPALQLALVLAQILFIGARFNKDSDKLF